MIRFLHATFILSTVSRLVLAADDSASTAKSFDVSIRVEASKPLGELKPIWRFFGADEPNYATMRDGKKLLGELGELRPDAVYFRTHNLLTTGDGTPALKWGSTNAYREDAGGQPIYDWTILDGIFDAYRANHVRPYVELGFMPRDLSIKPEPYQHSWRPSAKYDEIYTGWAYPPKSYEKWAGLVRAWTQHCVEKYGADEVASWYWETWNEPNIGYWRGTRDEFFALHDHAIAAVRSVLPTARVGGPDVAGGPGGDFLEAFLKHCLRGKNAATGETGTPLDFIAFHAKGSPRYIEDHVQMGIANQLRDIDGAFRVIARFPELKDTPIVIGESDPEGCAACQGPQLSYRNSSLYASYTAASFVRKQDLAAKHGVNLEGALTWAFTFENQPLFAGFRQLASGGIDLPVLNVFRMFSRMDGQRLTVESDGASTLEDMLKNGVRGEPDVSALASLSEGKLTIMVCHYHDDDIPGPTAKVSLSFAGIALGEKPATFRHFRIDRTHSNSYETWKAMGSPTIPNAQQYTALEQAGHLAELPPDQSGALNAKTRTITFNLPRQAVSLLEWTW